MKQELAKLVKVERKRKRELAELRALRAKYVELKVQDPKVLAMIDAEIKFLLEAAA